MLGLLVSDARRRGSSAVTMPERKDVEDARDDLYKRVFGPLPDRSYGLRNLTGIWPGGHVLQIDGRQLGGLTVTASSGLTNPGLPAPGRPLTPGLAGYGYELVVLTPEPEWWPVLFLSWAVPAEILHDIRFLDGVLDHGGLTIEDVGLAEGRRSDFLAAPAAEHFPAGHLLPNGRMRFLVATAITREQLRFAQANGRPALLAQLLEHGRGQVSTLTGPPPGRPA
jgi:hypothetical protein